MTYLLCDVEECPNHDGDGCMLELVEISRRNLYGRKNKPEFPYCVDYVKDTDDMPNDADDWS